MLTSMSATDEDFDTPILPGGAPTDYERYLNTEELLRLQKSPDEWVHRDELLFQVVHQSSELWLKLATSDVEAVPAKVIVAPLEQRDLDRAADHGAEHR